MFHVIDVAFYGLGVVAAMVHLIARKAECNMEKGANMTRFNELQRRYFQVFFLAAFADWLQGPYVYKLYNYYGYTEHEIAILYLVGFFSSVTFGTFVGSLADVFGRKKLCLVFCCLYSLCCFTKISSNYNMLFLGRILGGISTSILFTTFEAWYIHEHLRNNFPQQWVNFTMSTATFFNAILAIIAGVIANFLAESFMFGFGPVMPFLFAIPVLFFAGVFILFTWEENDLQLNKTNVSYIGLNSLKFIFTSKNFNMIYLGMIQSIFEAVMYTFVFLWTPVLWSSFPQLGYVFSCFMMCIMIGSSSYAFLLSRNVPPEKLLTAAVTLAFVALGLCTGVIGDSGTVFYEFTCFFAFLLYEVSVGLYYPAIGYLRSRVVPEEFRSSITNWFRVPMNFMVCCSLLLLRDKEGAASRSSQTAFTICSIFLLFGIFVSIVFTKNFKDSVRKSEDVVLIQEA